MKYKTSLIDVVIILLLIFSFQIASADSYSPQELRTIAFDKELNLNERWKALSLLAIIEKEKSLPDLKRAIKSDDWFMRNAGLQSMQTVDSKLALKYAQGLLRDPALVVRSTAVRVIAKHEDVSQKSRLWEELNNSINFRKGQSLWLRYRIVETLAKMSSKFEISNFIPLLDDSDGRVKRAAMNALESLTGETLGEATDSLNERSKLWKKWWSTRAGEVPEI